MSIEFACPSCGDLIRTPEGTAGKRGQCPFCKNVFTIPQRTVSSAPLPVRIGPDGKLEFSCLGCGLLVRVPASAGGKRGQCPHCSIIVQIPELPAAEPSRQISAAFVEGEVEFNCPRCHEAVRTPSHAIGKRGMCPHCEATFVIPTPPLEQPAPIDMGEPAIELTIPPAKHKKDSVNVSTRQPQKKRIAKPADGEQLDLDCPTCGRKFRIPATLAGRKGRCPQCQTSILIPGPGDLPSAVKARQEERGPKTKSQPLLTPSEREPAEQLTPISKPTPSPVGLTSFDETGGLTPIGDSGLTPINQPFGLTPIDETAGLTPIDDSVSGLTPIGPGSLTPLTTINVDDGRSLIPLRDRPAAQSGAWSHASPLAGTSVISAPRPFSNSSQQSAGLTITFWALLITGALETALGLIMVMIGIVNGPVLSVLLFGVVVVFGLLQILGAFLIQQQRSYGWCLAVCIIALFNPCLGVPVGILGLIMLSKERDRFVGAQGY